MFPLFYAVWLSLQQSRGMGRPLEFANGDPLSVQVTGNLVTNSAEALRSASLCGLGLFLAPDFFVADDLRQGSLVALMADHPPIEFAINAIYPHRRHLSTKVRRFLDLLTKHFAERDRQWTPMPVLRTGSDQQLAP